MELTKEWFGNIKPMNEFFEYGMNPSTGIVINGLKKGEGFLFVPADYLNGIISLGVSILCGVMIRDFTAKPGMFKVDDMPDTKLSLWEKNCTYIDNRVYSENTDLSLCCDTLLLLGQFEEDNYILFWYGCTVDDGCRIARIDGANYATCEEAIKSFLLYAFDSIIANAITDGILPESTTRDDVFKLIKERNIDKNTLMKFIPKSIFTGKVSV